MKRFTHSAFSITTDTYVGLGLINCVLISLAFKLLQSILFVGYAAVGLDGEIFLIAFQPHNPATFLRPPHYGTHFSTVSVDGYNPTNVVSAVNAHSC